MDLSLVSKTVGKIAKEGVEKAGKNGVNKTITGVSAALNASNQAINTSKALLLATDEIKDACVLKKAQKNVSKAINAPSLLNIKEENIIKDSFDNLYKNIPSSLKRFKYTFMPLSFPSGQKVSIDKKSKNILQNACELNKTAKIKFDSKDGDEILGVVAHDKKKFKENCFYSIFERKANNGQLEKVSVCHFPKSGEIRIFEQDLEGNIVKKVFKGNKSGGSEKVVFSNGVDSFVKK